MIQQADLCTKHRCQNPCVACRAEKWRRENPKPQETAVENGALSRIAAISDNGAAARTDDVDLFELLSKLTPAKIDKLLCELDANFRTTKSNYVTRRKTLAALQRACARPDTSAPKDRVALADGRTERQGRILDRLMSCP
jgi:hypothetical protein